MDWTAERIALLKRLRDDGASYAAIAAQLGISRGAVSGKVDRLGLATREPAPRGPRKPRVVLKTRPGIERPGSSPHAGLGDAASGFSACGPFIQQSRVIPGLLDAGRGGADPAAQATRACSLLDLTDDTCRWPVGDVGEPGFYFCGQPPLAGAPYCGPHCRKAFRPLDVKPVSEFLPDRDAARVLQPDTRFGQFAHWDVT